jgi:hypothetical protein
VTQQNFIPRLGRTVIFAAAFAASAGSASAQAGQAGEYDLKAAFLLNFAKYVEWPASATRTSFVVGVVGADPFGGALEKIEGKPVRGLTVAVKKFKTVAAVADCDLLFVPIGESTKLSEILAGVRGKNVLLVGESSGFATGGGGVNFVVEDKKLRFEINQDAAADAGLKISSQLLKLARVVKPAKEPERPKTPESRPGTPASAPAEPARKGG